MPPAVTRDALYHPFHLCTPATLQVLLSRYRTVHFRDYMALRLTPLMGTTAYQDRMGDQYPELVASGRLVQGHDVSGPLPPAGSDLVDRTLADAIWRTRFHRALQEDRRFQRGLFDLTHAMRVGRTTVPGPAALLTLLHPGFSTRAYTLDSIRRLARATQPPDDAYAFEYGLALVKTTAAEWHTVRLAQDHHLIPVTDSCTHHDLLTRTIDREALDIDLEYLSLSAT